MWFTESAWPPIFVCIGLAGLCVAAWISSGRGRALAAAGGLLVLCPVIYLAERVIVTDAERVEAAVRDIAAAYAERDLDGTLAFVADDATLIQDLVRGTMEAYEVRHLRITDVSINMNGSGQQAVSHFRANATVSSRRGGFGPTHQPTRWEFTWRREGDAWKLTHVTPLQVVTGARDESVEQYLNRTPAN